MRRPVVRMCGLSSTTTSRARPTAGTHVLVCPPGSLLRASRSSASACGTLRGRSTTGTGKHVSVLGTSLLFLLADGLRGEGLGISSPHLGCHSRRRQRRHVQGVLCSFLLVPGPDAWRHGRSGPEGQLCSVLVLLVIILLVLCSLLLTTGPWFAASWPLWTRRTLYWQWHVQGWFCLFFALRTLCSLLPFTGPDTQHHGRYGPEVQLCQCLDGFFVLGQGRSHARCVQRHMPMVQTAENCAGTAVAVRLNVVVDISCRGAVADPMVLFHRDSSATVH